MAPDATDHHRHLGLPPSAATALAPLSEPVRRWFNARFGVPTPAQRLAWPALERGDHLLVIAPTGSGKTLAALLPFIGRLLVEPAMSGVRCLYVAPLKALVADARRNLRLMLAELSAIIDPMEVQVAGRTGDTPATARRRLHTQPPDLLLTTPESLALLLSQPSAGALFGRLSCVIVDEIHALAGNKRGADLTLSLERLQSLTRQPLQRVGLSATCTSPSLAAHFLVGVGRSCSIAQVPENAPLELRITQASGERESPGDETMLAPGPRGLINRLLDEIASELIAHRTTLIFANTRALAERIVWALRRRHPEWSRQTAVHHSSVAAARRRQVERRLKAGKLRAVVCSASLELGIDIGSVDSVVLVHPPGGVVRLLQRVGRAGHAPGRPRRGLIVTDSPAELLEATITAADGRSARCEPLRLLDQPLDVLCQQLLGMAVQRSWGAEEAFDLVRRSWAFRDLERKDFDDCLDYLSGWHKGEEARLPARLQWRGDRFVVTDQRTARLLYRNIGTIVAADTRPVCTQATPRANGDDNDRLNHIGRVDESYADRLRPGDRFLLDGRCLEFRRLERQALLVDEVPGRPAVPRWQGSGWPLSPELARRIYLLRARAGEALRDGPAALGRMFAVEYDLGAEASAALVDFFQRQECVSEVPDAAVCLVEVVPTLDGADYYLHTPLNRAANDALARVAVLRRLRQHGRAAPSLAAELGFLLSVPGGELLPEEFLRLLAVADFDSDLSRAVAESITLRERFRCVALTSLMLLKNPIGRRRRVGGRDWAERRLFERVRSIDPDFVLLRQARREVFTEALDAGTATEYASQLPRLQVHWRRLAQVSPFAEGWTQAAPSPPASGESPTDALLRLHARLMAATGPAPAFP